MNAYHIIIAGHGGQGILFAGKFISYAGMIREKNVSWLPTYGPEMRGGTAKCSVIISDAPVGSPIVTKPDVLIAMNLPSLDRYEPECAIGAKVIVDSALVPRQLVRTDLAGYYIPAQKLAEDNGLHGLTNMIMVGKAIREIGVCAYEDIEAAMEKTVPERKKNLLSANLKAVEIGYNFPRYSFE
ncbi:MAG: 2-oxoacid:acceptor oxidoreductase family protein [Clostridiales bacterium]|jgi:2-oxoglutarate ferredoxin oxidoreductase subunit gamma|nr:2-oxoacid:acceptor oxidoreductase family protein [Clostridiales bacterium]